MKLTIETVEKSLKEISEAYGVPAHIQTMSQMDRMIFLYHRELAKLYTEETFPAALSVAWQQARRFPVIADFHRGFDAPAGNNAPTMEEIGL